MGGDDERRAIVGSGEFRLVMLPRDPERAYVYWEWPEPVTGSGVLTVYVDGRSGRRQVECFDVEERLGGRFVAFGAPDRIHRCSLDWGTGRVEWSRPLRAPRRHGGDAPPRFVRVRSAHDGLHVEAVTVDYPSGETFSPTNETAPSS